MCFGEIDSYQKDQQVAAKHRNGSSGSTHIENEEVITR
jgi:hypothetical protein